MLFATALLAFLQMTWIPGRIVLGLTALRTDSRLQRGLYIFSFSLLLNYLLVFLLASLGLYRPAVVAGWLGAEALLLVLVRKRGAGRPPRRSLRDWLAAAQRYLADHSFAHNLLLLLALLAIAQLAQFMLDRLYGVFVASDAALSWNRWALQWAGNQLPTATSLYPQLLPANWSLAYRIMGSSEIQFVPRNVVPLFPMATVLLFIDLGRRRRDATYFLAGFLFVTVISFVYGSDLVTDGMMDLPVAFFSLLAFYVLHQRQAAAGTARFDARDSLLALLFAAAAAVTKQAGLFAVLLVLAWSLGQAWRNRRLLARGDAARFAAAAALILGVVVLTWYGSRFWLIRQHRERAMIYEVTQKVHNNRAYGERLQYGFTTLFRGYRGGPPRWEWAWAAALLLAASLAHRRARRLTLLVVLPFTLLWALFYSYDCRNLSVALPFAALALAWGGRVCWNLACRLRRRLPARPLPGWAWLALLLAVGTALPFTCFDGAAVRQGQLFRQRRLGELPLNTWLYSFYRRHGFAGKIFSSYPFLRVLPELRDYVAAERSDPAVSYLLENYRRPRQDLLREIRLKVRSGEYALLFAYNEWHFIQVRGVPPFRLTPDGLPLPRTGTR